MRKNINKTITALLLGSFLLSGCATIVSKDNYPVNIRSNPSGINFSIKNKAGEIIKRGKTPTIVNLNSGAKYFRGEKYLITFEDNEKNIKPQTFVLDSTLDPWYLGNLFFGGALGLLIIDPATGAMFRLPPKFEAELIQEENKNYIDDNGNEIIIGGYIKDINSLTEEEKKVLIKI